MPERPPDHFSAIASAYAKGRFGYPTILFDALATVCAGRGLAWDCATGSGQAVRDLASRFAQVIATDISAELLARAPPLPNVTYKIAAAEQSPLAPASADLVTVAQAIHWFDLPAFWTEVRRVAKPGGILAFWGYTWPITTPPVDAALRDLRTALLPHWPERSRLLHDEYRGITPPFTPVPAPDLEIHALWTRADFVGHVQSWSAVRYARESTGADPVPRFAAQLAAVWPENVPQTVRWPLHLRIYRV